MSAPEQSPSSRPSRRWSFRIGLRWWLILLALLPVGMWYWWQRPFQVVVEIEDELAPDPFGASSASASDPFAASSPGASDPFGKSAPSASDPFGGPAPSGPDPFGAASPGAANPFGGAAPQPKPKSNYRREVRTVRRVGVFETIRDGATEVFDRAGRKIAEENWKNGKLHGRLVKYNQAGVVVSGEHYLAGELHGPKKTWSDTGELRTKTIYKRGKRIGRVLRYSGNGLVQNEFEFNKDGQIIRKTRYEYDSRLRRLSKAPADAEPVRIIVESLNDRGRRTGFFVWTGDRKVELRRETYRGGVPHGAWVWRNPDGGKTLEQHWRRGVPVGVWMMWTSEGEVSHIIEFRAGRIVRIGIDGRDFSQGLIGDFGGPNGEALKARLGGATNVEFIETPLVDVIAYLEELHAIPIIINRRALAGVGVDRATPITASLRGVPLHTALAATLMPRKLVWVGRFDVLMITTVDDALNWRDQTGVPTLSPPADSNLANALEASSNGEFIQTPLADVIAYWAELHNIEIRLAPELAEAPESQPRVTISLREVRFRSLLAMMLDAHDLACSLDEDALVIHQRKQRF